MIRDESSLLGDMPPNEPESLSYEEIEAALRSRLNETRALAVHFLGSTYARRLWAETRPSHSSRHRPTGTRNNKDRDDLLLILVARARAVHPEWGESRLAGKIGLSCAASDEVSALTGKDPDSIARRIRFLLKTIHSDGKSE